MKVLVYCECSGRVRSAFRRRGHDAWSCDILPADDSDSHHILEVPGGRSVLEDNPEQWDLMIAHPPCTYLALCQIWRKYKPGQEWRKPKEDAAVDFFRKCYEAKIPRICVENPMSVASTRVAKKSQTIHPWQFGHPEQKTTWLWLRNLPPLMPTQNVRAEMMLLPRNVRERIHYMPPGPNRSSERDKTFPGIAEAMAEQWGHLC